MLLIMSITDCTRLTTGLAFALVVILFSSGAFAQNLSLLAPSLANISGVLTARFGVIVEEKPILKGELLDGAELVLKCELELYTVNEYWFDQQVSFASFESALKYDALTKDFTLTLPGRTTPLRNPDIELLLKEGWGIIEAGLGSWSMLERGRKYSLKLSTTMNELGAPEGFSRFIYFWSWDAGADNSFQLDFTY
ncbi:MAG: DUF4390 domain-containing protein [Pseudodesulfovibrio sp.]|nr:DUF4390 domain-containing protein [Pseudodesulfovibrio sp.]